MSSEQSISTISSEMQLNFSNEQLVSDVLISDSICKFVFDTGASNTVLLDTSVIKDYYKVEKIKFGKTKLPDNRTISVNKIALTSEIGLYKAKNEIVTVMTPEKYSCNPKGASGVIGTDYFTSNGKKIVNLDFESMRVKVLTDDQAESISKNYKPIKSEFYFLGKQVKIFLTVNGVEEPFHFDTGNSAAPLLIGTNSKIKPKGGTHYQGYGFVAADGVKSLSNSIFYDNVVIQTGGETLNSLLVFSDFYKFKYNNVGIAFIKNFNWIIDYKNKKVFFKKINAENIVQKIRYDYRVLYTDGAIRIFSKSKNATRLNLGDKILSVNGEQVNQENCCRIQSLLNSTDDWNTLKLEVTSTTK